MIVDDEADGLFQVLEDDLLIQNSSPSLPCHLRLNFRGGSISLQHVLWNQGESKSSLAS